MTVLVADLLCDTAEVSALISEVRMVAGLKLLLLRLPVPNDCSKLTTGWIRLVTSIVGSVGICIPDRSGRLIDESCGS
ncbi:hypothetical protein ACFXG4_08975 [Nocardia sp. NPDC059246]|uniref:hypothetical protein n=1 Tax=unclassified Nocardia TaxID=2637762 RepID=UPI003673CE4C